MNETDMRGKSTLSLSGRAIRLVVANAALAAGLCLWATTARAGNDGFFTTYTSDVERGEVELMLMNDFTQPSTFRRKDDGLGDYLSHMLELEYGVTNQFATEFMIEWFEDVSTGDKAFTGFRWENRYRLFERQVPLNPMVYVEYEDLDLRTRYKMEVSGWVRPPYTESAKEPDRERILETRLVLSHELGSLDVAFNWINETDLGSGTTAFGYSLGVMKMMHGGAHAAKSMPVSGACEMAHAAPPAGMPSTGSSPACACPIKMPNCGCGHCGGLGDTCRCGHAGMVALGLEAYGGLGDTTSFGLRPARQEHYLGPIFMYHLSDRWMFHAQLAIGLSEASDDLVRVNFGYEF